MTSKSSIIETLAIGDELLTGKISDTNSTFVANELFSLGLRLDRQIVIADDSAAMKAAVTEASQRADLVICFGGLGPTSDDKTASCMAELLGTKLVEHPESKQRLIKFVEIRKRVLTDQILKQIVYPEGTLPLFNNCGLAVGFSMKVGRATFFFLPGVPDEMKVMFKDHAKPFVEKLLQGSEKIFSHVWRCLDLPESELQRLMNPVEAKLPKGAWLGYRTQYPENHLTLYYRGVERPKDFDKWKRDIHEILLPFAYSEGSKKIEDEVFELLKSQKKTVAFVESCTGGIACHRMTNLAGASHYIKGAIVPYTREMKNELLGLDLKNEAETVSAVCAKELAIHGKEKFGADFAATITGYLGPTGGTEADPIGTIYIGVLGKRYFEKRIFQPWRDRSQAQWGAASHLLNLLRVALREEA